VVLRLTGTNSNPRILIHVVAGAVTGAALIGVSMLWKMTRFYDLVGYGAISVAVFIFVLYILREFNKNDVRFFLSVINPGEMRDYLSSEFRK
jgi:hypothetical protein